jgi:preprotein translocase SecE subunit
MNSFITYLRNVRSEFAHIVWPTQKQALGHLFIIVLISIITAVFIAGIDYLFTQGVGYFVK